MKAPASRIRQAQRIALAVQRVFEMAEFDQATLKPSIVPLKDLINAYPIRQAEQPELTHRRAVEFLIAETGQSIPIPEGEDRSLAGFLYVYEFAGAFYGCILVKKDDPVARRRFSAAHELGHYVLHFLPLLEHRSQGARTEALILAEGLAYTNDNEAGDVIPSGQLTFMRGLKPYVHPLVGDIRQIEREANQFAAELLMPAKACGALVDSYSRRFGANPLVLARRLATEFLVSQEAMKWRLAELGLLETLAG